MSNLPSTHDQHATLRGDDDAALLPDPMRVLVVEDDAFQAMAIRELIMTVAKSRIAVTLAGSLSSAVEAIQGQTFDIVLLDLMLPDATGMDGLNRVVQIAPRLPVLVLTGFGKEELVVRAFQHGAQDYLIKGDGDGEELLRAMAFAVRRKAAELRRLELARRDPLTGLANRGVLLERMQRARHRADREKRLFAVLFVDLDGFKKINDSMGHMVGDQVLRSVARCLAAVIRQSDTVARLGGDEFVILAEGLGSDADAAAVAKSAEADRQADEDQRQHLCHHGQHRNQPLSARCRRRRAAVGTSGRRHVSSQAGLSEPLHVCTANVRVRRARASPCDRIAPLRGAAAKALRPSASAGIQHLRRGGIRSLRHPAATGQPRGLQSVL